MLFHAALVFTLFVSTDAAEDGLALTSPMGYRNWNQYQCKINQQIMMGIMDSMVDTSRGGISLLSLGYKDVGLGAYNFYPPVVSLFPPIFTS